MSPKRMYQMFRLYSNLIDIRNTAVKRIYLCFRDAARLITIIGRFKKIASVFDYKNEGVKMPQWYVYNPDGTITKSEEESGKRFEKVETDVALIN